jgi:hypothetical protein
VAACSQSKTANILFAVEAATARGPSSSPRGVRRGVATSALDPQKAQRLWQVSLELIHEPRR